MAKPQTILQLRDVTRDFIEGGKKITALHKTNFSIKEGEFVAIVGPSGSGKSTFLTIAGGLQNPSQGEIVIHDNDITQLSTKALSKVRLAEVGFILQASNLVPYLTVEKQLVLIDRVMGRKRQSELIEEMFKNLGLTKLRSKYPGELSGGERQRVAIAKVLYGSSSLILADEPTASLDSKRAFEVVELLARETRERNKATIMVTHDERLLRYCDAVYNMSDGVLKKRRSHKKEV